MTRKIFALVICILTSISSFAQTPPNNEIWYTTTDGQELDGNFSKYLVSNSYSNGRGVLKFQNSVTEISGAFRGCTSLTSINIPNSVTEISGAFRGCTSLTSINIPNSVTEIGGYAFRGCTSLTSITIPDSVTVIGYSAFSSCTSLTSINIPNSVTEIGNVAFSDCTSLTSINIPDSVTAIKVGAFSGCNSLENVTIPNSVIWIGDFAFNGCTNLTSINIPNSVTKIGLNAFRDCTSLTSINIPDSVTDIGIFAFEGCNSLENVTIPDSVTQIEAVAFRGCTSLTSITIPNSVTEIGYGAFGGCTSLKSFKGKYASSDGRCLIKDGTLIAFAPAGLTSYTIPDSVTEIGWSAFDGCTGLKSFKGKYASSDGRCLIKDGALIAFAPAGLTSYTIPDSVTQIEDGAFSHCTSLTSITIPDSVTEIGENAFWGCTSLTSINIPDSVTEIGDYAFWDCTSLTSITIPNSVTDIGVCAFYGCTSLTSINIPDSVTEIGVCAFWDCTSLTSITIPDSVTKIGGYAFWDCTSLTSITIPNSGIGIEYDAFEGCNIEQITISAVTGNIFRGYDGLDPSKVVAYTGKYASEDGRCLIKDGVFIDIIHTGLTSYVIPENITTIGKGVFKGCSTLKEITIPNSVTMIDEGAFEDCNIERITINAVTGNIFQGCDGLDPSKVVAYTGKYASEDGRCLIKDGVLIDIIHTGLTSYVIPENITTIGEGVFKGCSTLKKITIPNSVTMIGKGAFDGCNIERITINAVTGNIFRGCNGLDPSKVVAYTGKYASEDGRCLIKDGVLIDYIHNGAERYQIPNGVTIISDGVFRGCSSLTSITCLATTPPQITTLGISEEAVIYVPKESVKLYKKAEGWEVYKKQIKRIKE